MAYDEIADLILELTLPYRLNKRQQLFLILFTTTVVAYSPYI